jgi:hypothetical protein
MPTPANTSPTTSRSSRTPGTEVNGSTSVLGIGLVVVTARFTADQAARA